MIIMQLATSFVTLLSIIFYIWKLMKYKDDEFGLRVLGNASQITFSAFVLGFATIIIWLNVMQPTQKKFVACILLYAAFVCLVNMLSIIYCEWTMKRK